MSLFIGFLTVVLVLDSLLLILLVLIQLPKKEAGAGVAFGGGATDALFGAGSGNALTKITKYAATIFFSLSLIISILYARNNPKDDTELRKKIAAAAAATAPGPGATLPPPASAPSNISLTIPAVSASNPPAATTTNPPATTPPATTPK
ncbi:MAG: preprotein translocase subunit SecG [Verrucomicrobia bacterium]|nr:preprotein translocase subunit SecG [Verrucomicrobiota bacterium]